MKATYYHEDSTISKEEYFKNKKLTGKWTRFDKQGNKVQLAFNRLRINSFNKKSKVNFTLDFFIAF